MPVMSIHATIILVYAIIGMTMLLNLSPLKLQKRKKIFFFVSIVLIVIGDLIILTKLGRPFITLYPLFTHLPVTVVFCVVSGRGFIKVFFVLLTMIFLSFPPTLIVSLAKRYFEFGDIPYMATLVIACILVLFLVTKIMMADFLYVMKYLSSSKTARFCFVPLGYNIIVYVLGGYYGNVVPTSIRLILFFSALGVYSLLLSFFRSERELAHLQNTQSILNLQFEGATAQLDVLRSSQEQTAIYRHDMRHHITLLSRFALEGDIGSIKEYLAEIKADIGSLATVIYCQNNAVNLILSSFVRRAKKMALYYLLTPHCPLCSPYQNLSYAHCCLTDLKMH